MNTYNTDHLTLSQYKTYIAEPMYVSVLILIRRKIPTDIIRVILHNYVQELAEQRKDLSDRTYTRLLNSIEYGNLIEFKLVFETEYLRTDINAYFIFDDQDCGWVWNNYSLCLESCNGFNTAPSHIYRHYNELSCNCHNGKRCIAFTSLYNLYNSVINLPNIYGDKKNMTNRSKKERNKCNRAFQSITNYLFESGPLEINYKRMVYKPNL